MTHQPGTFRAPGLTDAGAEIARLREVLALVREIGGGEIGAAGSALDEAARVSSAYASALPIVQRRFDEETGIVARWAAAGLEALLILDETGRPAKAAASRLALELERALARLARIVAG
jgi:hypothetical protein